MRDEDAALREQRNETLRQAILMRLMRLAGHLPNVRNHKAVLRAYRRAQAGKADPRRHGPARKSADGSGKSLEELHEGLLSAAMRRAGASADIDNWRALAQTLHYVRGLDHLWAAARRGPRPPNRLKIVAAVARETTPDTPGKRNAHAIAVRILKKKTYSMSLRKLEGLVGDILG
jgi:hypothetical protein